MKRIFTLLILCLPFNQSVFSQTAICSDAYASVFDEESQIITPDMVDGGSTGDNISLSVSPNIVNCSGNVSVTLTVSELDGSSATCNAIVFVQDYMPPVANCPPSVSYTDILNQVEIVTESTDNCGIAGQYVTTFGSDYFAEITVYDEAGNEDYCFSEIEYDNESNLCFDAFIELDTTGHAVLELEDVYSGEQSQLELFQIYLSQYSFDCADIGFHAVEVWQEIEFEPSIYHCTSYVTIQDGNVDCTTVGISENDLNNSIISAYPNPSQGQIILSSNENNTSVNLLSVEGKVVLEDLIISPEQPVEINNLNPGVYMITTPNNRSKDFFSKPLKLIVE